MPEVPILRQVGKLLREQADGTVRAHLALAVLLVGAGGLLSALAPLALSAMVDAAASGVQHASSSIGADALVLGAAYVLALCAGRLFADLGPLVTGVAEQRLGRALTRHSFEHILALPMGYLLQRRSGEFVRSIDLAKGGSQLILAHAVNSIVPVVFEAVAMAAVLAHLAQPALLATFAVTACAYLAIFCAGSRRMTTLAGAVSSASLEQHALLSDSLQHCEVLRCFVGEQAASDRVDGLSATLERRWRDLNRMRAIIGAGVSAVFTVSLAMSLYLAGRAVIEGSLTAGGFVLANVYMLQVVRPLEVLGMAVRDLGQAIGFMRPLTEILREAADQPVGLASISGPAADEGASATAQAPDAPHLPRGPLVLENVHFGYDARKPVLRGVDLEVRAGQTVAIVGVSGSGKSSLARLLLRLYRPQGGRILFAGRPIESLPVAQLRSRIALVPQDTSLFSDTIAHNIAFGRRGATRQEIVAAARQAQLHEAIASWPHGYETLVGERGLRLSGGERQRVAIARALLRRPDIFVFDEATSMLDSRTEAAVLANLRSVTADCATILIAHRLSSVMHADEIVVLDDGILVERGRHAGLLARDAVYARMWRRQIAGSPLADLTSDN